MSRFIPSVIHPRALRVREKTHNSCKPPGTGTEVAVTQILFLRNGFTNDPGNEDSNVEGSAWGVGLGIPAERFRLRFDYTHSSRYYEPDICGSALSWDL